MLFFGLDLPDTIAYKQQRLLLILILLFYLFMLARELTNAKHLEREFHYLHTCVPHGNSRALTSINEYLLQEYS